MWDLTKPSTSLMMYLSHSVLFRKVKSVLGKRVPRMSCYCFISSLTPSRGEGGCANKSSSHAALKAKVSKHRSDVKEGWGMQEMLPLLDTPCSSNRLHQMLHCSFIIRIILRYARQHVPHLSKTSMQIIFDTKANNVTNILKNMAKRFSWGTPIIYGAC